MSVNAGSVLRDSLLKIRSIIASGVTDPISATRPTNSQFILTSYPDRPAKYPVVTLQGRYSTEKLGAFYQGERVDLSFEARVWARNEKEKNDLADRVHYSLKNMQTNSASGTEVFGLYNMRLARMNDVDEEGKEGIKSKVLEYSYMALVEP